MINDKMFRGLSKLHNEFVFGYINQTEDKYWLVNKYGDVYPIDIDGLSMSTGIVDKNGIAIYGSVPVNGVMGKGGDIVALGTSMIKCEVVWDVEHGGFGVRYCDLEKGEFNKLRQFTKAETELHWTVIGNQFSEAKI